MDDLQLSRLLEEPECRGQVVATEAFEHFSLATANDVNSRAQIQRIVMKTCRPALSVPEGIHNPPQNWRLLSEHSCTLERCIKAVGAFTINEEVEGTCFAIAGTVVVTAAHVLQRCVSWYNNQAIVLETMKPQCAFCNSLKGSCKYVNITEVLAFDSNADVALLRTDEDCGCGEVLTVQTTQWNADNRRVAVVGFPVTSKVNHSTSVSPDEMAALDEIFGTLSGEKKLSPGIIRSIKDCDGVETLIHDCSTYKGSSGSPVISIEDGVAVGIHTGGQFLIGNKATATWNSQLVEVLKEYSASVP